MTEFYKLFFDVSLYYLLSGYFTILLFDTSPSVLGLVLLIVSIFVDSIFQQKKFKIKRYRIILLILPVFFLLSKPSLWKIIQIIPAWAFISFCIITERYNCTYDDFRSEFSLGLKLLFLLILGPLFQDRLSMAVVQSIPYLIIMLSLGVCMLRLLREKKPESLRQGVYMLAFILLCIGLTIGNIPQLLLKGISLVYQAIIAPLIFGFAVVFGAVFYFSYIILKWLVERAQGNSEDLQVQISEAAEAVGLEEQIKSYNIDFHWLKILLLILLVAFVIFVVFIIFKRLVGSKKSNETKNPYSDSIEKLKNTSIPKKSFGIIKPRDPRLLVRYYYSRFLAECTKREISIPRGKTVEELIKVFSYHFSSEQVERITEVYSIARYSEIEPIDSEKVSAASIAWKELKHTKKPKL